MPRRRKPHPLRPGATIGIAAPAGPVDPERLLAGERLLHEAGFETFRRGDLFTRAGYLAGDDERRAGELMALVRDDRVDAILCARGGYGSHRIISQLDAAQVRAAAKPLVGYSDITTLLLWQWRCAGLIGFHGPMLERGECLEAASLEALIALLSGSTEKPEALRGKGCGGGRGEGRLMGGSLSLVVASLGTPWEIDPRDAILLLEEVNEPPYRIDRMLEQLHAAGKLDRLAGVGIGAICDCKDTRYPEPSAEQVIRDFTDRLDVPIVTSLPFGHGGSNQPWPFGVRGALDGDRGELQILEPGVQRR